VLEETVACFADKAENIMAWLGPPLVRAFEVGPEVREAFMAKDPQADRFRPAGEKYFADIYQLARQRLEASALSRFSAAIAVPQRKG
jgi:copper oxidase (laccase) domain-containing protein